MSDTIHTVPTPLQQAEAASREKRRREEAEKWEEFLRCGIKSQSAPRVSRNWDRDDEISHIKTTNEGLQFRVSDQSALNRGREHEVTVSYRLIEDTFIERHGDQIARKDAKIAELEEQLRERDARLADIAMLATRETQP